VENLYRENKDKTEKTEELYKALLKGKNEIITVLKDLLSKNNL